MITKLIQYGSLALALAGSAVAHAEDIDLFAGGGGGSGAGAYVVFMMDTGASFSANNAIFRCSIDGAGVVKTDGTGTAPTNLDKTNGGVEQCALYSYLSKLDPSSVSLNMGVTMFNNGQAIYNALTGAFTGNCAGGVGGCLVLPMVPFNAVTKPYILDWIKNWTVSGNTNYNIKAPANRGDGAVMQETWAYYAGKTGISGTSYASIAPATGCGKKYVVWLGNNYDTQASPKDAATTAASPKNRLIGSAAAAQNADPAATAKQQASITDTIPSRCVDANPTAVPPVVASPLFTQALETAEIKGAYALNWAGYMFANGITTTTIAVQGPTCDTTYAAQMEKMGSTGVGGGKFYKTNDFSTLSDALGKALSDINADNTAFAAVSLPVSVNTQGSYLNQVYIGMFRPEEAFGPRWVGNLKQYKLGLSGADLQLQDADSVSAINSNTGFLKGCARSYWTPSTKDTYWEDNPQGDCLIDTDNAKVSNSPDGNVVEKGAQGYVLRSMDLTSVSRDVKTCSTTFASCTALTDFATTNGAITSLTSAQINWARGLNSQGELGKATNVHRPSVHGDVVHSRPVPVNYGSAGSPSIVVFYGGNDGMLRAVNGNRGCTVASDGTCPPSSTVGAITHAGKTYVAGSELWSFMPPEFYGNIQRLYANAPAISYPGSSTAGATPKSYGMDGPVTATKEGSNVYVYATMRRGGRVVYAFNATQPAAPSLLWKKGCPNLTDDAGCSSGFTGVGQTWGSLKTVYATGYDAGSSPLVIMAGGYDACEDASVGAAKNHSCASASTKGNKVYVLDAVTGAVVKAFDTTRAVVADSTIVVDGSTGKIKYAYTADMGGNVYRMEFGTGAPSSWTITKIASLGCDLPASCTDSASNRKFMFAPSVVTTDNVNFHIMLGSGDREKPVRQYTASYGITNYFFMLQDRPSEATWLTSENANCGADLLCLNSLQQQTAGTTSVALGSKKGWYLGLRAHEQVVTSAITIYGVTSFSTHIPQEASAGACTTELGTTSVYNINYKNAASANGKDLPYELVPGGGLPPSPVGGLVTLDDGTTVPFCIGCSPSSPLEAKKPPGIGTVTQPKNRIYWYLKK